MDVKRNKIKQNDTKKIGINNKQIHTLFGT